MNAIRRCLASFVILTFLSAVLQVPLAAAQDTLTSSYRVGPGDRVLLTVPQRPDLTRELVIAEDGTVTLPLIGGVSIGGMTSTEIEARMLQALREYYPSVSRIEVRIIEAVSQVIYVSGQVRLPGKYAFTSQVNVWEAIREAGGPMPDASLDNVRIIKDRARGGTSTVVNVFAAIEGGSIDALPDIDPGDTIIVPTLQEVYTGTFGVNVMGAVVRPGTYRLQARQDLIGAILQAGGPSALAQIKNVTVVRPRADGTINVVKINLKDYLELGDPVANPKLYPGDTVNIAAKSQIARLADIPTLLSITTALGTLILLWITVKNEVEDQ